MDDLVVGLVCVMLSSSLTAQTVLRHHIGLALLCTHLNAVLSHDNSVCTTCFSSPGAQRHPHSFPGDLQSAWATAADPADSPLERPLLIAIGPQLEDVCTIALLNGDPALSRLVFYVAVPLCKDHAISCLHNFRDA